ncbi:MAG: GNAT family N-acetyltransferase [Christensenellaceae bacterium]|nr:GNAT family N-acetyltransferase [Christensenellaceae bacterium]
MLTIKRLTIDDISLLKPISSASLVGEDVLLRIGRGGFALGYVPLQRAEWRDFPPAADADPYAVLSDERCALFAAFEDGLLVGAASLRVHPATRWAEVTDLRVEAAHRRQGVGRNLLDFCERLALKRGMHGLKLACTDTNPALCQFCEHCGFTLAGVDSKALAYTDAERDKPLSRRAALLTFYKPIQKG